MKKTLCEKVCQETGFTSVAASRQLSGKVKGRMLIHSWENIYES